MGIKCQRRVAELSTATGPSRFLLFILAYHAKDTSGICWPRQETLAEEMGSSLPTVKRLIRQLKDSGEVLISDGRGRGKRSYYIVTLGLSPLEIAETIALYGLEGNDIGDYLETVKGINIDTFYSQKGIETDTSKSLKGINFEEKGINIDTYNENINEHKFKREQQLHAAADFNSPDLDPELTAAMILYKDNIGPINAIVSSDFEDIFNGLSPPPGETKGDWVEYAVLTAASNGKNKWAYVKAIINGISDSGGLNEHRQKWNGHKLGSGQGSKSDANRPAGGVSGIETYAEKYARENDKNIAKHVNDLTN